jgi:hypothetical protein
MLRVAARTIRSCKMHCRMSTYSNNDEPALDMSSNMHLSNAKQVTVDVYEGTVLVNIR